MGIAIAQSVLLLICASAVALEIVEEDSSASGAASSGCRDLYLGSTCSKYLRLCKVHKPMQQNCQRTCGICKITPAQCIDILAPNQCKKYEMLCDFSSYIKRSCKRTCGYCPAVAELPCEASKFGCCWDNITKATGQDKQGCPACVDVNPNCSKLVKDCGSFSAVRRQCPQTCQLSCASCKDNPSQAAFCPHFKASGFCQQEIPMMRKYCAKTCDLCGK